MVRSAHIAIVLLMPDMLTGAILRVFDASPLMAVDMTVTLGIALDRPDTSLLGLKSSVLPAIDFA